MSHHEVPSVITAGKAFSSTALALAMGLALALPGSAALASNKPIPGIDIVVKKNPSGLAVVVPIDDSGKFSLRLKEPGSHTISTACRQSSGCLPHKLSGTLKPGADGEPAVIAILIGLLLPAQKASTDGTSYTFTVGDRGVVLGGQIPNASGIYVAAGDVNGDGVETRKAAPKKAAGKTPQRIVEMLGNQSPEAIEVGDPPPPYGQPVTLTASKAALRTDGGDKKLPGILRLINNSETDTATVEAINGIGGTGGGRLVAGGAIDGVNADSSNRDHIDQDAQTDIKKRTAVQSGGPGDARTRVSADVSTLRGTASGPDGGSGKLTLPGLAGEPVPGVETTDVSRTRGAAPLPNGGGDKLPGLAGEPIVITDQLGNSHVLVSRAATPSTGGDGNLPGLAGDPIPGVDVKLGKNPGGSIVASSRTDNQGNFHFDQLPAGNYELALPGLPAQSLIVGADGIAGGRVMRGPDGSMSIFDRWGNRTAASPKGGASKTADKPVGFGSGNTMGAGPGGMGPGPMSPPTVSPGPMGGAPGGGAMGPGRAMGGAGMGRP